MRDIRLRHACVAVFALPRTMRPQPQAHKPAACLVWPVSSRASFSTSSSISAKYFDVGLPSVSRSPWVWPVILRREDEEQWLDVSGARFEKARSILKPYPSEQMDAYDVSTFVNKPENDTAGCIQQVSGSDTPALL
jgi:SOS response associated peptidase (SRAP)